jgi:hypothetical protein
MVEMPDWIFKHQYHGSIPKNGLVQNEDNVLVDLGKQRFILADGASVSYDPKEWANFLCQKYLENPKIDQSWINSAVDKFGSTVNRNELPWMKQAAFDRGSFSTLLGVELFLNEGYMLVSAFGDTNFFILRDWYLHEVFPLKTPEEFIQSPNLISTNPSENTYLNDEVIGKGILRVEFDHYDQISVLMATDALAAWVLDKEPENRVAELFLLGTDEAFEDFVVAKRKCGELKTDDTSLITFRIKRDLPSEH